MIRPLPMPHPIPCPREAGSCRTWALWPSRCPRSSPHADEETPRPGADVGAARGEPGAQPASAADRACQQQCEALSHRERPHPPMEGGRLRSGDGDLLCPAQLPGTLDPVAANDLIGINSIVDSSTAGTRDSTSKPYLSVPMRPLVLDVSHFFLYGVHAWPSA